MPYYRYGIKAVGWPGKSLVLKMLPSTLSFQSTNLVIFLSLLHPLHQQERQTPTKTTDSFNLDRTGQHLHSMTSLPPSIISSASSNASVGVNTGHHICISRTHSRSQQASHSQEASHPSSRSRLWQHTYPRTAASVAHNPHPRTQNRYSALKMTDYAASICLPAHPAAGFLARYEPASARPASTSPLTMADFWTKSSRTLGPVHSNDHVFVAS